MEQEKITNELVRRGLESCEKDELVERLLTELNREHQPRLSFRVNRVTHQSEYTTKDGRKGKRYTIQGTMLSGETEIAEMRGIDVFEVDGKDPIVRVMDDKNRNGYIAGFRKGFGDGKAGKELRSFDRANGWRQMSGELFDTVVSSVQDILQDEDELSKVFRKGRRVTMGQLDTSDEKADVAADGSTLPLD